MEDQLNIKRLVYCIEVISITLALFTAIAWIGIGGLHYEQTTVLSHLSFAIANYVSNRLENI